MCVDHHFSCPVLPFQGHDTSQNSTLTGTLSKWANLNVCNSVEMLSITTSQCKTQSVDYCFHHEYMTAIVPFFSNPKNNSLQSVCSLHFTLSHIITADIHVPTFLNSPDGNPGFSK